MVQDEKHFLSLFAPFVCFIVFGSVGNFTFLIAPWSFFTWFSTHWGRLLEFLVPLVWYALWLCTLGWYCCCALPHSRLLSSQIGILNFFLPLFQVLFRGFSNNLKARWNVLEPSLKLFQIFIKYMSNFQLNFFESSALYFWTFIAKFLNVQK